MYRFCAHGLSAIASASEKELHGASCAARAVHFAFVGGARKCTN